MTFICDKKSSDQLRLGKQNKATMHLGILNAQVQVRFKNNIPPKCAIINCTLRLYCIDYCQMVIEPTDLSLLHFVYMHMCIKMVFGVFCSWAA